MGAMPPPPGMIFPPGMHPIPAAGGAGGTATEEIWVENMTLEGKVLTPLWRYIKYNVKYFIHSLIYFNKPLVKTWKPFHDQVQRFSVRHGL